MIPYAIELSGVCKSYQDFALNNLDFLLPTGQILGMVGVNGAGKSTTIRILMGLIQADAGDVNVLGKSMPKDQVRAKWDIGFASDDMRLYKNQTLRWHMDFIASIYPDWDKNYARELLRRFDLVQEQKIKAFSHGQRVKASLLLLLARRPKLLLLDEPTTGLDPVARWEILELLTDVLRDESRSVLFSSHITQDVERIADRILFLHQGTVLADREKEPFLDSWRCIQCQGQLDVETLKNNGITDIRHNGSLMELRIEHFSDDVIEFLNQQQLNVLNVNPMSLEDIFVTSIRKYKAA